MNDIYIPLYLPITLPRQPLIPMPKPLTEQSVRYRKQPGKKRRKSNG